MGLAVQTSGPVCYDLDMMETMLLAGLLATYGFLFYCALTLETGR